MALLPGRRLEISSHFMPLPRSSMISASSSGDHLLCFLAGDSATCGPMVRLLATAAAGGPGTTGGGPAYGGAKRRGAAVGRTAVGGVEVAGGTEAGRVCWGGETEDSFESGALRREAISTVAVCSA